MFNWLGGLAGSWGLGGWLSTPVLFLAGALAVSVPIIIHLLNKRKFRTIDWAAMDFLLEADKRNRRRVRLENLLLLLLRCLAILLIGLLLARPFWPASFAGRFFDTTRSERIVVLDDSLSMAARSGTSSSLANAKKILDGFVSELAADDADNELTLYRTSRPNRPLLNAVRLDDKSVVDVASEIKGVKVSDLPGQLDEVLLDIEDGLSSRASGVNRVVYILSDLRSRDWLNAQAEGEETPTVVDVTAPTEKTAGCFVLDVGGEETGNVVVSRVEPRDKSLIAGVRSQFDVTLVNRGTREVSDVNVKFTPGESLPIEKRIQSIPPGKSASEVFSFTFTRPDSYLADERPRAVPIRAEIDGAELAEDDLLAEDNARFYAARVIDGIPTLVVDGDPSAVYGRSESFYLKYALAPTGSALSGVSAKVITDVEFETTPLGDYQVVFLCNLYRISETRREALRKWVEGGGGLVFMLGGQIDDRVYNEDLYAEGDGLLPVRLVDVEGDPQGEQWVYFDLQSSRHPVLGIFEGENNPFVEGAKIFRYWLAEVPAELRESGDVSIPARYTDAASSPAMVERSIGEGRVVVLTTAADVDWNNWPQDHSYLVVMQELVRYLAPDRTGQGTLSVGDVIREPFDFVKYDMQSDVAIEGPGGEKTPLQPQQPADDEVAAGSSASEAAAPEFFRIRFDGVSTRGFYRMEMKRKDDGRVEERLYAANVDPREGDLQRVERAALQQELGEGVRVVGFEELSTLSTEGARSELWLYVLAMLVGVLACEQLLGWWFGRRR